MRAKFKVKDSGKTRYPDSYLYHKLGLLQLSTRRRAKRSWANV